MSRHQNTVLIERDGPVTIVSINRPERRNAVDGATAKKLYDAFLAFDADDDARRSRCSPASGGTFCAGRRPQGGGGGRHPRGSAKSPATTPSPRWARAGCGCRSR